MNFNWIIESLKAVKEISIKKMIILFICIYPLFTVVYFKDELSMLFKKNVSIVEVRELNKVIRLTNNLKDEYNTSFVSVWVYQPSGDEKLYKERVSYSGDYRNKFIDLEKVNLIQHPNLLNSLRNNKYIKVDKNSSFELSKLVSAYEVGVLYIIPIKNEYGLLVAEVMVAFDKELNQDKIEKLINSTELIRILM
ncbi:hypothetical protein BPT24_188 [Tenacibaculum phage pT24]|uniref:Uncharacterized protein n=1 Tax=Tenacibaculum phage pT24 TaxID=1880590 RepID=A0A1B4XWY0_9CAUD|nr:hypothetical protein HYP10_gp188 [Tenacibaculum phage pT24]BAV39313.1 hypothetical protein BPT24_188 [Tenacibaculum phage pT24]